MPLTETISLVAIMVLAGTALVALLFAVYQVAAFYRLRQSELRQAEARLLFDLDKTFEGRNLTESRIAFFRLWQQVKQEVSRENLPTDQYAISLSKEFSARLSVLRGENLEEYSKIMRTLGFFETLGVLVAKGYVELTSMSELYGGAIIHVDHAFREHIKQGAQGAPPGYYSNFLALAVKVRKLWGLMEAGSSAIPPKS